MNVFRPFFVLNGYAGVNFPGRHKPKQQLIAELPGNFADAQRSVGAVPLVKGVQGRQQAGGGELLIDGAEQSIAHSFLQDFDEVVAVLVAQVDEMPQMGFREVPPLLSEYHRCVDIARHHPNMAIYGHSQLHGRGQVHSHNGLELGEKFCSPFKEYVLEDFLLR